MDHENLKSGGRYFFIGQRGYEPLIDELFGGNPDEHKSDRRLLDLLDKLPSFDPFLMREQLRRHGIHPSRCYFEISDSDCQKMTEFVESEIRPLIAAAFGDLEVSSAPALFAAKILSSDVGEELAELKAALGLSDAEYQEGVFCWKGFLYYKWSLSEMAPRVHLALEALDSLRPCDDPGSAKLLLLRHARSTVRGAVVENARVIKQALKVYDEAYANLTHNGRPAAFRAFLLQAPSLFGVLGDGLGTLRHFEQFWHFRMLHRPQRQSADELLTILDELRTGIGAGSGAAA